MADVSDADIATVIDHLQRDGSPVYSQRMIAALTELQARRVAEAKNGVGGTVAGCRERLCHSSDPHCQWPACHTARAALGARDD